MRQKRTTNFKHSYSDKIFDAINVIIMILLLLLFIIPLWFVLIASISDPLQVSTGKVILIPKGITLVAYETLLEHRNILTGYGNTIFYTLAGTFLNLVMTILCAFPLSRKDFMPRKLLLAICMFTMYFNGGLIPSYLVMKKVGLLNTRWAMIIPGAISVYNMLVMRTYFINSIPGELQEAATLDGANIAQYLVRIVLPLSKPVIAVIGLYYAVSHWNDYYNALIYLYDDKLYPLQSVLRELLMSYTTESIGNTMSAADIESRINLENTLKYSVIVAATIPMMCVYPFIQKFFVKGIMIGSVKG